MSPSTDEEEEPRVTPPSTDEEEEPRVARGHWAFQAPASLEALGFGQDAVVSQVIDELVERSLAEVGLSVSQQAPASTLLRRISLDLTGLPPSLERMERWEAEPSQQAWEEIVDELLASTAFGERWARHWLDQARFSESDGYEKDLPRWGAYRYRDWVIDAFNRDMAFDEFTVQQIAGDRLPDVSEESRIATAFHTQTLINREGGVDYEEDRIKRVSDRADTVASTWLGLTLECAHCHNHPYDPISQKEYFQFFSFFNRAEETSLPIQEDLELLVLGEPSQPPPTYLLTRGDFHNPDVEAGELFPGVPGVLPPLSGSMPTAGRLELANWLMQPDHPLTARVRVNNIWAHLFGAGLVSSLGDFGVRGAPPSHPLLLDFLARRFVQSGFQQKELIRQIVLSQTYQQASLPEGDAQAAGVDPDNRLLHRQNRQRLEAETIWDQTLSAGGLLDRDVGGPSVFPPLPEQVAAIVTGPYSNFVWADNAGQQSFRRGLYVFHKRAAPYPTLSQFDWPTAEKSIHQRMSSLSPTQALSALHDPTFFAAAQGLAMRVLTEDGPQARLTEMFRLALGRSPEEEELTELQAVFEEAQGGFNENEASSFFGEQLPEDVPVSEAAAYVLVARVLLNLDEFFTRD